MLWDHSDPGERRNIYTNSHNEILLIKNKSLLLLCSCGSHLKIKSLTIFSSFKKRKPDFCTVV